MSSSNHKILGMDNHVAYGVCFIVPILAIVALIADRQMTKENKQFMWEAVIGLVAAILLGLITFFMRHALGYVMYAIMLFIGVLNLIGHITHLPFADRLAEIIARL